MGQCVYTSVNVCEVERVRADGVWFQCFDLVSDEVSSNRLSSNLLLFVSQDTFRLHSEASSSSRSPLSPNPQPNTPTHTHRHTQWGVYCCRYVMLGLLLLFPQTQSFLLWCFSFNISEVLTSSFSSSCLLRTRKLQIRNIPPHLQWEVSSLLFLFYTLCVWDSHAPTPPEPVPLFLSTCFIGCYLSLCLCVCKLWTCHKSISG